MRLQKEIEVVRKEIKEAEGRLRKEITELEGRLRKEIEQVRLETKALEVRLTQAMHRQTMWIIGAVGAIVGLVRVLDALIT